MSTIPELIGKEYVECNTLPKEDTSEVRHAYRQIARVNETKYQQIDIPVIWVKEDPYDSFTDMKQSVKETGKFKVFTGGSHPKFLTWKENVKNRAVHDWHGHLSADCDFSFTGEYQKWLHVKSDYPSVCENVLFAEIVGQLSAAIYLSDGFGDSRFTQRSFQAPDRWVDMARRYVTSQSTD